MGNIANHGSGKITKLLCLGDSGSGKTGALAALAVAGYNLRIIDVDNGLDILRDYLTNSASPYVQMNKDCASQVEFETVTDTMRPVAGRLIPTNASVWTRVVELLDKWKTPTADFGNISTWGEKDVLVIDTLSILADHALKFILKLNLRLGQKPHQSDWYEAQQLVMGLLEKLYDDAVKCNVIVNCHIRPIEDNNKIVKMYPESVGKTFSPKIGRYFNNVVLYRTVGQQKEISTKGTGTLDLKTSSPLKVKEKYLIQNGLAELFKDLRA